MGDGRQFATTTIVLGVVTFVHALVTWPLAATLALFVGGAAIAFLAEAVVINRGWLEHHIGPKILGVPPYLLFGWTGTIYIAFRLSLLVTESWLAVVATAALATTYDILIDHRGVGDGHWSYTDELPGPRYRGVPWWNFVGWLVISGLTAAVAFLFL